MSVSREQLMRYHDGELPPAEARVVEAALEQDPSLLEELDAYADVGSFMRAWDQTNTSKLAAFDISDSVLAAIEPPRARVHSLLPRIATWVSLGAAIAAGSVLVVRSWSAPPVPPRSPSAAQAEQPGLASPSASAPELSAVLAAAAEEAHEPPPPPATIESVDFGSNTGEVFVRSTDTSETPVIWMPDDGEPDDDNEDRSESL